MTSELRIPHGDGLFILEPIHSRAIRVRYFEGAEKFEPPSVVIVAPESPAFTTTETSDSIEIATTGISARFDRRSGSLDFYDGTGNLLLSEVPGSRKVIPCSVQDEPCFSVEQAFHSQDGELLHGLGQFQDGHFNVRGVTRRLVQVNTQIAIPFYVSNQGYGLLWHQYGLTDFNPTDNEVPLEMDPQEGPEFTVTVTGSTGQFTDTCRVRTYCGEINIPSDGEYTFFLDYEVMTNLHELEVDGVPVITQKNYWLPPAVDVQVKLSAGKHRLKITATKGQPRLSYRPQTAQTVLRSPHAGALDYVVFAGPRPDEIIAAFRAVTGAAPLLPRWAYGFWQCRERYETQAQLLKNARKYRARDLPVDVMVQDWQYWPNDQWAGMQFDPERFPNPAGLVDDLLALNLRLVISVWENVSKDSELGRFYEASACYIPDSPWLDATNPSVRAAHWAAIDKNLNHLGIAGWWLDGTEPENDALVGKRTHLGPGERHRLTYPLYVSQAVADGQRNATPERRACILTRSAFPGQQRYNAITWSGDIGGDWDAFRRQIVAGLNYCASGLPYWTTDIGGFFRPEDQYTNQAYHELLTRWFQYGVFNPILRIHGFGSKTEVWRFGAHFEENTRQMLNLRYRLLPYIYSAAWQVTHTGATLMRPLMWDFPNESAAREAFAFLFGPAFLVAPITGPGVTAQPVALPQPTTWYDFWTGSQHLGGQTIVSTAPLERIPLFVRAGSLVPLGPFLQHTSEKPADPIELRIYPGADGRFELYEDAGDGQAYEQGELAVIPMCWDDDASTLTLGARRGSFPGMTVKRTFRLVLVRENHGTGIGHTSVPDQEVVYTGTSLSNPIRKLVS